MKCPVRYVAGAVVDCDETPSHRRLVHVATLTSTSAPGVASIRVRFVIRCIHTILPVQVDSIQDNAYFYLHLLVRCDTNCSPPLVPS